MTKSLPFTVYTGAPDAAHSEPPRMGAPVLRAHAEEVNYYPDPGLVNAVNVAFALGQPLLLAGPPGCGKTQLAYSVAREMALGDVLKVSASSTTELAHLYFGYDHMTQFSDLQRPDTRRPPESYLRVTGLGRALLLAGGPDARVFHEPGNVYDRQPELTRPETFADLMPAGFFDGVDGPVSTIVLVDEIDKAPRDVPNDMLGWLETMSFEIAELGLRIAPFDRDQPARETALRPVIFFTTNGEKRLPDPFLRRCAFYSIPFPSDAVLTDILVARTLTPGRLTEDAINILHDLHAPHAELTRPPSVAEFISWVVLLNEQLGVAMDETIPPDALDASIPALVKLEDDVDAARQLLRDRLPGWSSRSGTSES